ncbi:MAG: leucine-rich repeat domain-containing protein [Spirosomataceae bacterium]
MKLSNASFITIFTVVGILFLFFFQSSCRPDLKGALQHPTEIKVLDLSSRHLRKLPTEIGEMTNLEELNLANNFLSTLPLEFSKLKKLKKLNLSGNYFRFIPSSIIQLTNLEELSIEDNRLTTLPTELALLKQLRILELSWNQLKDIPLDSQHLPNLQQLRLYDNPFISPYSILKKFPSLPLNFKFSLAQNTYNDYLQKGSELLKTKKNSSAIEYLGLAIHMLETQKVTDTTNRLVLYESQSRLLFEVGDYQQSLKLLNSAIELRPDKLDNIGFRGELKQKLHDLPGACQDWQKVLQMGDTRAQFFLDRFCKNP